MTHFISAFSHFCYVMFFCLTMTQLDFRPSDVLYIERNDVTESMVTIYVRHFVGITWYNAWS